MHVKFMIKLCIQIILNISDYFDQRERNLNKNKGPQSEIRYVRLDKV